MNTEITEILNDFAHECFAANSSTDINFKEWTYKVICVKNNITPEYEVGGMPRVKDIIHAVCKVCNVTPRQLKSKSRMRKFSDARGFYAYLGRRFGFTTVYLGRCINRDHATILHHDKKFSDYLNKELAWFRPELKYTETKIKHEIAQRLK